MAQDLWYRLDNIGKFYSSQAGGSTQTVFRYSATLADPVDPAILQEALTKTVGLFPSFNVCLRSGMFWHYLQRSPVPPQVQPENLPICFGLHVDAKSVLFRVSYYRDRVNFEVSHIVSDGRGSLGFFKALLYIYLQERYGVQGVAIEYDGTEHQQSEDSFDKYYDRDARKAAQKTPRPWRFVGWRDPADLTFMEYHLPLRPVLDQARSWGVGLTALVAAALMVAIRNEMPRRDRGRPLVIDVPVDLRQFYPSVTARNFFGLAFLTYVPGEENDSLETIAQAMNEQLKTGTAVDVIKQRVNRMVGFEKNPLLRFAPLFIKDLALEIANFVADRESTTTLSNLGAIRIDDRLAPYVRDINVLTSAAGLKFTMCSFKDDLSLGIVSAYSNLAVIKNLCRLFKGLGIEGRMNINKTSEEIAEDQLEAAFEESVKRLAEKGERR